MRNWLARFRSEGHAGLQNRSSSPRLVANQLPAHWLAMVTRLRRDYRMTGEEIAERLHLARSTVAGHLARLGLGRLAHLERREPARRYNRMRAGERRPPRCQEARPLPQRRAPHHRRSTPRFGRRRLGVRPRRRRRCLQARLRRGPAGRAAPVGDRFPGPRSALVPKPRHPGRAGHDHNGSGYVSRLFRKACRMLRLRHLRTRRFIQTLLREWAYALPYRSSDARAADLPRWLRHYNHERPPC